MKATFWRKVWQEGRLGFHQEKVNSHLTEFFPLSKPKPGSTVFVPLAGKSKDLLWIRDQGVEVLAVELSRIAVEAFFEEAGLSPNVEKDPPFERWSAEGITFLCGDFFALTDQHLNGVDEFYDRASLIALPPEMRAQYVQHLGKILPAGVPGLLITVEYPQGEMNGPPFSVGEDEVRKLFADEFSVQRNLSEDILERTRFRERLSELMEKVFVMRRNAQE